MASGQSWPRKLVPALRGWPTVLAVLAECTQGQGDVVIDQPPRISYIEMWERLQQARRALEWIAEYGTREGDLIPDHPRSVRAREDAMQHIALNALTGYRPQPSTANWDARVEAAARAWWSCEAGDVSWSMVTEAVKGGYRARAAEALAAVDMLDIK